MGYIRINDKDLRVTRARTWARHAFGYRPSEKQIEHWGQTSSMGEVLLLRVILDEAYEKTYLKKTSTTVGDQKWVKSANNTKRGQNEK